MGRAMIRQLISGTDLRGKAVGDDARLTPAVAERVGMAFAAFLKKGCCGSLFC